MKKYLWLLLIPIGALITPFLVDWLVVGSGIHSNISNEGWVTFLGSYTGAIIGAISSFIGIILTIRYTNSENKKDRELQVAPYCTVKLINRVCLSTEEKTLGDFYLGCEPRENEGPTYRSMIYVKNIGMGPAIEFDFSVDKIEDGRKHFYLFPQWNPDNINNEVNLLQPGEEAVIPVCIKFNFDPIRDSQFVSVEDKNARFDYDVDLDTIRKYKNFNIVLRINYKDLFKNSFSQIVELKVNMSVIMTGEKEAHHAADVCLGTVSSPTCKNKIF